MEVSVDHGGDTSPTWGILFEGPVLPLLGSLERTYTYVMWMLNFTPSPNLAPDDFSVKQIGRKWLAELWKKFRQIHFYLLEIRFWQREFYSRLDGIGTWKFFQCYCAFPPYRNLGVTGVLNVLNTT